MARIEDNLSIVRIGGEYNSSCGYCHSDEASSVAFGMTASHLTVEVYQDLLDRGWRRSGTWLYLPSYDKTCCPCYTHRLDATKFHPTKAQAKALRKFERYLDKGNNQDCKPLTTEDGIGTVPTSRKAKKEGPAKEDPSSEQGSTASIVESLDGAAQTLKFKRVLAETLTLPPAKVNPPKKVSLSAAGIALTSAYAFVISAASSKISCKVDAEDVAAHLVQELRLDDSFTVKAVGGHLNFYRTAIDSTAQVKCDANSCQYHPSPRGLSPTLEAAGEETGMHHNHQYIAAGASNDTLLIAPPPKADAAPMSQGTQSGKGIKRTVDSLNSAENGLKIVTRRSSADLVALEFPLYRKYQTRQHHDPYYKITPTQFKRFLIDTPLVPVEPKSGQTPECGLGSFHQQYWIDGVLVAVGVVDILPGCLSSKYFFWDPDLASLGLGKISAMKEIEWVLAASASCPTLRYYYMGYYIHTCPKMRYKIDFQPADLLCPKALLWIPFDRVKGYLESRSGKALSEAPNAAAGLGLEYIPRHRQQLDSSAALLKEADTFKVTSLKAILETMRGQMKPMKLEDFIKLKIISPRFVEIHKATLEQLAVSIGSVACDLAILL